MEVEYIACSEAVQEALWLKRFMKDLEINISATSPVTVYCDSQATISFSKDANYQSKSKHIETKYNYIRDILAKKEASIQYISTHSMIADPLTKAIARNVFASHARSLVLRRL